MTTTLKFKTIRLFKDQILGIGSYGKVCKAKCDDLTCAAKLLHETLFDSSSPRVLDEEEMRKFKQKLELLHGLRHPNIVQCLGIYEDPNMGLPVLMMELIDESLTTFLEKAVQPVRYDIQVNLCHDISVALSYLHSNEIIHRDLSSNNVLLVGSVRAKVADFGMAKLSDLNPQGSRITMTRYPGTDVYMPPECCKTKPTYSEKVDCFSFGVLVVQILTRKLPDPGEKLKEVEISDPSFPSGLIETPASEKERRQNHIGEIDPNHPLLPLALKCLKYKPDDRPSAQQLCVELSELKECKEYRVSSSVAAAHESSMVRKNSVLYANWGSTVHVSTCDIGVNTEKDELIVQLEKQIESQWQELAEQNKVIGQCCEFINEQEKKIKEMDDLIKQKDHNIEELEQTVKSKQELIQQEGQQVRSNLGEKDLVVERERQLDQQLKEMYLFKSGVPSISSYFYCVNNIASVPFIGMVEVIVCDSLGCEYWNSDHDITIRIPAGAISPSMMVHLEVAVTLYGPFQFPNGSYPISPILWICVQENIALKKPFEVILPHFVNGYDTSIKNPVINFAKADHKSYSLDESGMKHYVFKPVDTAFVNIKEGTRSYGILSTDHCCYYCIIADNPVSPDLALSAGYSFWCIEKPLSPPQPRDKILLCTTFFLESCITVCVSLL